MPENLSEMVKACAQGRLSPSALEAAAEQDQHDRVLADRVLMTFTQWENSDGDEAQLRHMLDRLAAE